MAQIDVERTGSRSPNIAINLVPFVDVMSCLTAFLLVTAVWVNTASLNPRVAGRTREAPDFECDCAYLSVLVEPDAVLIGLSRINEVQRVPRTAHGYDWPTTLAILRDIRKSAFGDGINVEIAGGGSSARPVTYQSLILAMDIATQAGFDDIGMTDPQGLAVR